MALILDAGPIFAALDVRDTHYEACRELIDETDEDLLVPAPVLAEVDYLIRRWLYLGVELRFLQDIAEGAFVIADLTLSDYVRIREICEKYADADIGLVDASIVAIAERLNEPKIATLDHRHFGIIKPRHVKSLQLLPRLTRLRPQRTLKK